jgi:hypothetical protein
MRQAGSVLVEILPGVFQQVQPVNLHVVVLWVFPLLT